MNPERVRRSLVLLATCLGVILTLISTSIVGVALPAIQTGLGASGVELQWVLNSYILPYSALLIAFGVLGDRFGRRRSFLTAITVLAVGSVGCALAPTLPMLLSFRVLQGMGSAFLMPATLSILSATFMDQRARAQAIGVWAAVSGLALAVTPAIGGLLVDGPGWRWVFIASLPIALPALLIGVVAVPRDDVTTSRSDGRFDLLGAVLTVVFLTALCVALIEGRAWGWGSAASIACLTVAVAGIAVFVLVELRTAFPLVDVRLFRSPVFATANLGGLVAFLSIIALTTYMNLFFQNVQGRTAAVAGLYLLPIPAALAVVGPVAGRITGRIGPRRPMAAGLIVAGVGVLLLLRLRSDTPYTQLWWNFAIIGAGFGLALGPMTVAAISAVPLRRAGMSSAVHNACRQVGQLIGVAGFGLLVTGAVATAVHTRLADGAVLASVSPATVEDALRAGFGGHAGSGQDDFLRLAGNEGFVAGLHHAFLASGLLLLVTSALAWMLVRDVHPKPAENAENKVER